MTFIGSISQPVRSVLAELAPEWRDRPVYVGCSGNFTVERTLHAVGCKHLFGNDVSLYSCALGRMLAGREMKVKIADDEFAWMGEYLGGPNGIRTVSCIALAQELFQWTGGNTAFHRRQEQAVLDQWPQLYEATLKRIETATEGVRLEGFFAGDVFEHIEHAPDDAVCISFPPTYEAGYEKLYAKLESVFDWRSPSYEVFKDDAFEQLTVMMREKWAWVTLRDYPVGDLEDHLISVVQTGMRSRVVFVYAGTGANRIVLPSQSTQPVPIDRAEGELECEKLEVAMLTQGQMNTLRSEYLSAKIVPAAALINLAVLCDGKLIGALAFSRPQYGGNGCYMMSDFAITGTSHARLSKLVLTAAVSEEVKTIVEQALNRRCEHVTTTAFSEMAASMKYRGLFKLEKRAETHLQYGARLGRWTLEEGLSWWASKYKSA